MDRGQRDDSEYIYFVYIYIYIYTDLSISPWENLIQNAKNINTNDFRGVIYIMHAKRLRVG